MSVQDITELFQHIVQSEEKIKQRFEALKKVSTSIQECREELKSVKYESDVLHGKIATVNHKLIQEKIQKAWLEACHSILMQQFDNCLEEKENLTTEIKKRESHYVENRANFLSKCGTFLKEQSNLCYGIGQIHYKEYCEEEYNRLVEEHKEVLDSIDKYKTITEKKNELEKQHLNQKEIIEEKVKSKEELEKSLNDIKYDISYFEVTKNNLTKKVSTDPEFRSILQELEASKDKCALSGARHQDLTRELFDLQKTVQLLSRPKRGKKPLSQAYLFSLMPNGSSYNNNSMQENRGKKFCYQKVGSSNNSNNCFGEMSEDLSAALLADDNLSLSDKMELDGITCTSNVDED